MPKSCRESRPGDHTKLTFEGAPSFPAARGQYSPGAAPGGPLAVLQGGCGRKFQGWSQPTPPFLGSPKPPTLPVYLRCALHSPGSRLCALAQSFSGQTRSLHVSQSQLARSLPTPGSSVRGGARARECPRGAQRRRGPDAPGARGSTAIGEEQTPGRGRRRAPGMRISRHWGCGAGHLGNRASLGNLRWSLEKTVFVVKVVRYEVNGAFCETKYSPDKS